MIGKRLDRFSLLVAMAVASAIVSSQVTAATVAHWSFDSATLTLNSGNIVGAADATGNHNATVSATGFGGATGDQFVSTAFNAAASSVAGRFGQALRFNGDNYLVFNNLTELMAASGAPSYTISMWINAATGSLSSALPFATLGNWGHTNAAAGPTRFVYAFGPAGSTTMRGQSRRDEPTSGGGGTNGDDLFGRNATTPAPMDDGAWHMLSWTFNTTSGELVSYFDGAQVDMFTSTDPSFAMANSASAVGSLGLKADNGIFLPADFKLDEVLILDQAVSGAAIRSLYTNNVVPEPTSWLLYLAGTAALGHFTRRRS
jgi:hypothetical protein